MILFPFCIHNILSTLSGVHFSFKASLTCLGTAAVPSLLRRVFMKLDWGVPLVTTISSPSCVHSSFVNFPGVNLSFNNSLTRSGTVVLLPLLRTVVSRKSSKLPRPGSGHGNSGSNSCEAMQGALNPRLDGFSNPCPRLYLRPGEPRLMRRVIVSNAMSLDGFVAGPNGELDWFAHPGFLKSTRSISP